MALLELVKTKEQEAADRKRREEALAAKEAEKEAKEEKKPKE